ncbi:hypothetical protein P7C70_g450, partial [Phenoliferia sp. Uapishka_3]
MPTTRTERELPPPPGLLGLRQAAAESRQHRRPLQRGFTSPLSPRQPLHQTPAVVSYPDSGSEASEPPREDTTWVAQSGWAGVLRLAKYGTAQGVPKSSRHSEAIFVSEGSLQSSTKYGTEGEPQRLRSGDSFDRLESRADVEIWRGSRLDDSTWSSTFAASHRVSRTSLRQEDKSSVAPNFSDATAARDTNPLEMPWRPLRTQGVYLPVHLAGRIGQEDPSVPLVDRTPYNRRVSEPQATANGMSNSLAPIKQDAKLMPPFPSSSLIPPVPPPRTTSLCDPRSLDSRNRIPLSQSPSSLPPLSPRQRYPATPQNSSPRRSVCSPPLPTDLRVDNPQPRVRHTVAISNSSSNYHYDLPPLPSTSMLTDAGDSSPRNSKPTFPGRPLSVPSATPRSRTSSSSTNTRNSLPSKPSVSPFPTAPLIPSSAQQLANLPGRLEPRSAALKPRSAVPNYFNIDFSFLYDEEPPLDGHYPSRSKQREKHTQNQQPVRSGPVFIRNDIFPSRPRRNVAPDFPAPAASPSRRVSQAFSPSFPSPRTNEARDSARIVADHRRTISFDSIESSDSNPSYESGAVFRRSHAFEFRAAPRNDSGDSFSEVPTDSADESDATDVEKQKQLAEFLSEAACAMEGGKSLAMVDPESFPLADLDSRSREISAVAAVLLRENPSRPPPRLSRSFTSTAGLSTSDEVDEYDSGTSRTSSVYIPPSPATPCPARGVVGEARRHTRYYTPVLPSDPRFDAADDSGGSDDLGGDCEYLQDGDDELEHAPIHLGPSVQRDLGTGLALSAGGRSPSTLRAGSPYFSGPPRFSTDMSASSDVPVMQGDDDSARLRSKMLDRRARTIGELIETEATFACDMAVVRDIFLARARGCDMATVADHVMMSGLGLSSSPGDCPPSPLPSASSPARTRTASKSLQRRPTLVPRGSLPLEIPQGDKESSPMSAKDVFTIFANLEDIAGFAESFSELLDGAWAHCTEDAMDDRVGEAFLRMIPRIQKIYSSYCARHHRAIVRLQELEPSLRAYLAECKQLSHGRTNAWDLASLLIKPVQRCLKYPLLLNQILAATPTDHPDYANLERANRDMLNVAGHINDFKKGSDLVSRIVSKKEGHVRRESASTAGSFGRSVTKKLLRGSQRAKQAVGLADSQNGDEMFDTFVALVESTRNGVLRFSNEMREWSRTTRFALDAQATMVEGWTELYSPTEDELKIEGGSHDRLLVFLDTVLRPVIDGPYRELNSQIRMEFVPKTDHLLTLFENPLSVIAKRNEKLLDHTRYLAKPNPQDKRGSEDYITVTNRCLDELPRFLGQVSRYFNIIITAFATAQASYHQAVQQAWDTYAEEWFTQIPEGPYSTIEETFAEKHRPMSQIMDSLAAGLGLASAQLDSRQSSRPQYFRTPALDSVKPQASSDAKAIPENNNRTARSYSGMNRTSNYSDSSAPSIVASSVASSDAPPSLFWDSAQPVFPTQFGESPVQATVDRQRISYLSDSSPTQNTGDGMMQPGPRIGRTIDDAHRLVTSLSMYIPSDSNLDEQAQEREDEVLYVAEAAVASKSNAFRDGTAILSFEIGDALYVQHEEADSMEGGSGWLMGRKDDGDLGWARSEDFMLRED